MQTIVKQLYCITDMLYQVMSLNTRGSTWLLQIVDGNSYHLHLVKHSPQSNLFIVLIPMINFHFVLVQASNAIIFSKTAIASSFPFLIDLASWKRGVSFRALCRSEIAGCNHMKCVAEMHGLNTNLKTTPSNTSVFYPELVDVMKNHTRVACVTDILELRDFVRLMQGSCCKF